MARTYTVKAGDSWERIAQILYNDQRMFGELMRANAGIGSRLHPGDVLRIPDQRSNPFVSNSQAALAGIPQNPRGQLYNAYDRNGVPNASVATYDPISGKWTTTPIGGTAAASGAISPPAFDPNVRGLSSTADLRAPMAPPAFDPNARGLGNPYLQAASPMSTPVSPLYNTQGAAAPRTSGQPAPATGGPTIGPAVTGPNFVSGVPTPAAFSRLFQGIRNFGPGAQAAGQAAGGAIANAVTPRQPTTTQPLQSGIGLPPAKSSQASQTATQQETSPGALQTIMPVSNATSATGERIAYTSPVTASVPELTLQNNLAAFDAAYSSRPNKSMLPAVLTAADLVAMSTARGATLEQMVAAAKGLGYNGISGGSMFLTGAPTIENNPLPSPSGGIVNSGLPDATWAEASSLYGLPRGYGAPTYNSYGYTAGGRRNPSSVSAGAYGLPAVELMISSGTNQ